MDTQSTAVIIFLLIVILFEFLLLGIRISILESRIKKLIEDLMAR